MTRQREDLIQVDGEQRRLRGFPLEDYFEKKPKRRPDFPRFTSSCHRGYVAEWQVIDGKLYLIAVMSGSESSVDDSGKVTVSMFVEDYFDDVFPDQNPPVFANWVSSEFYTEVMDKSNAEKLTFKKGVLVSRVSCEPNDPYADYQKRMGELFKELERKKMH